MLLNLSRPMLWISTQWHYAIHGLHMHKHLLCAANIRIHFTLCSKCPPRRPPVIAVNWVLNAQTFQQRNVALLCLASLRPRQALRININYWEWKIVCAAHLDDLHAALNNAKATASRSLARFTSGLAGNNECWASGNQYMAMLLAIWLYTNFEISN